MRKLIYAVFGLVLLAAAYLVLRPTPEQVESVVLKSGDFAETILIEGKIRSRTKQIVYAFATGDIENLQVKGGDLVKKGQVVTRLDWDHLSLVKSPMDGVVSKIFRESAGPITRGEPIFEVSRLADLEVVAELQTPDAIRLKTRGEVKILNWGGEGELPAEIVQISRAGMVKISALGVEEERTEVRINFKDIPDALKERFGDLYHVDVLFIISRESNVLTVPLGALLKSGEKWAVYTIDESRAHLKEIEISKRNDQVALVTAGLREGDRVILFPGDKIREGNKVKY